uniref:Growth arrest-specific 7a n=1 Tax=Cyprinus carpio TaxID=7962 RepID=A0A8C1W3X7_CYPCA
ETVKHFISLKRHPDLQVLPFKIAVLYLVSCSMPSEEIKSLSLPVGWKCYRSPEGQKYYVNISTKETTWERPSRSTTSPKTSGSHQHSGNISTRSIHAHTHCELTFLCFISLQINCVTFPVPASALEQQLLKPSEWSYCDYFWADKKDPQGATVSGFEVLLQKQLKGKQMQKEMAEFIRERIKIEEEYAKNLSKLSMFPMAAQEEGTLGEAWAQLKKSLADEAEVHLKFSSKLQSEVEKPLLTFRGDNFKKDMKKYDHHIADLRKQQVSRYAAVEKARKALADRQKDLEVKTQQLEIKLSNKTEEDIKKARRKSTQAGDDLMRCVDLYNQAQSKWFEEMVTTSLELERLEVERVETIQQLLRQYTTLRHETDMFNQSTLEPVDQLLQSVDPAKDRELWVKEHKTGDLRPVDMDI